MMTLRDPVLTRPVTREQMLEIFGISKATLRRWVASGKLPEPAVKGGRSYWSPDVLDRIFQAPKAG